MGNYQSRKISFQEVIKLNDWHIKVYTIAKNDTFDNTEFYKSVLKEVPKWLSMKNGFDSSNDKIAFLILHSGKEGIFSLINWWVGKNMLNTHIFFSEYHQTADFKLISGNGLAPCVWELEIINNERISWTSNILKASEPDYATYLNDVINLEL